MEKIEQRVHIKAGEKSVEDRERSGCPITETTLHNVQLVQKYINDDLYFIY